DGRVRDRPRAHVPRRRRSRPGCHDPLGLVRREREGVHAGRVRRHRARPGRPHRDPARREGSPQGGGGMSGWKLLDRYELDNGWTVLEYEHETIRAYACPSRNGGIMRATEHFTYIPSERVVRVLHFIGSTEKNRDTAVRIAATIARRGRRAYLPENWTRRRHKGRTAKFTITTGPGIDLDKEFAEITERFSSEIGTSLTGASEVNA